MRLNCGAGGAAVNSLHRGLMRDGELIEEESQLICLLCDALGK